jgi:peptidoglycan biosynthesis protein MviN/MurJ (putative lipid II flippase)
MYNQFQNRDKGSVELIVLGLLAALIVVLALPLLSEVFYGSEQPQQALAVTVTSSN